MIFQQPAYLWFLLALAIPILIHLLNFRRPRKLAFSQLTFVKAVQQVVQQRMRLKRWLLLAARLLAVFFLVMAFAGPMLVPKGGVGGPAADRSVLILVDNSLSMQARDANGLRMQEAKNRALEIIASLAPSDEVSVQGTGKLQYGSGFTRADEATQALNALQPAHQLTSLSSLLEALPRLFSRAQYGQRVCYLLSDFQASTWLNDSLESTLPEGVRLVAMPIGQASPANLYASGLSLKQSLIQQGQPVEMGFSLHNTGSSESPNTQAQVLLNEQVAAIVSEELAEESSRETHAVFTPRSEGFVAGKVQVDDSQVPFDNERYFVLPILSKQRLLFVEGQGDSRYLRTLYEGVFENFEVSFVDGRNWAREALSQYAGVVLAGVQSISSGQQQALRRYVAQGGGLLYFPAREPQGQGWQQWFAAVGMGQLEPPKTFDKPLETATPDLAHPLFEGLFTQTDANASFEGPSVRRLAPFRPAGGLVQANVLATRSGQPLFHEAIVGKGKVFMALLYPDLQWSDWPLKTSFAPMIYRASLLMSGRLNQPLSFDLGALEPYRLATPSRELVRLQPLQGEQSYVVEQIRQPDGLLLDFANLPLQPGHYRLSQGDSTLALVAFNLPKAESALKRPDTEGLQAWLEANGLQDVEVISGTTGQLKAYLAGDAKGGRLWQWALLLALLFLLAEMAITQWVKT